MNPPKGKQRYAGRKTPIRAKNAVIRPRNALHVISINGELIIRVIKRICCKAKRDIGASCKTTATLDRT